MHSFTPQTSLCTCSVPTRGTVLDMGPLTSGSFCVVPWGSGGISTASLQVGMKVKKPVACELWAWGGGGPFLTQWYKAFQGGAVRAGAAWCGEAAMGAAQGGHSRRGCSPAGAEGPGNGRASSGSRKEAPVAGS